MIPFMYEHFGNPSSPYSFGIAAKQGLELARKRVAAAVGASSDEITFTYGGTESSNIAIKGAVEAAALGKRGNGTEVATPHVITTSIEHPCVAKPLKWLAERGLATVTTINVNREGLVDPKAIAEAVTPETCLVTVMHANNEVGTVQPIAEYTVVSDT